MTPPESAILREKALQPNLRPDQWVRNARDREIIVRRKNDRRYTR